MVARGSSTGQSMKLTARDRKLVIVLPGLALVIGYCWLFDSGPNGRLRQLRQQIARARENPPPPFDTVQYETQLAQATRELTSVEAEIRKIRKALMVPSATSSNKAAEQVAALLPRHHLALLEQAGLTAVPKEVSPSLLRLAAQVSATNGTDHAAFWRVKFAGTYLDTVAALDELAAADFRVTPACLTMADGPTQGTKTWTLVLWM